LDAEIIAEKLPVAFKRVISILPELISKHNPQIFIGLGLSGGRPAIMVERVAINIMDSEKPDNDGYKPEDELIIEDGPVAYFATIPVKRIIRRLRREGIPAFISNSAGTYVCNTVMYLSLHLMTKKDPKGMAGFIHLPYLPEQVLNKPQPSMSLDMMIKAIKLAIEESVKEFKGIGESAQMGDESSSLS